jgi:hypothetical protein
MSKLVAYRFTYDGHSWHFLDSSSSYEFVQLVAKDICAEPLYTHPVVEQPSLSDEEIIEGGQKIRELTDDEILVLYEEYIESKDISIKNVVNFGRAVLKKASEK